MRNITEQYGPGVSFWEVNPQFKAINPYKRMWESDRTKGKKATSDIMWAIALAHHPKSDLYYISDKEERIAIDIVGVKTNEVQKFWEDNKYQVEVFIDAALTQAEKSLLSWERRLKQRDEFLSTQTYSFGYTDEDGNEYRDNTKSFDDMQSKTAKFYEEFFKIKKELMDEAVITKNKREKSATAGGDI